jgi:hypothetical protein
MSELFVVELLCLFQSELICVSERKDKQTAPQSTKDLSKYLRGHCPLLPAEHSAGR